MKDMQALCEQARQLWPSEVQALRIDEAGRLGELRCAPQTLPELADWLFNELSYQFAGLIVEEAGRHWELRYLFYGQAGRLYLLSEQPLAERSFPSLSTRVHAADWQEREAEDLFGLVFSGHPRLGDFVLHDDLWPEGLEPMRRSFTGTRPVSDRQARTDWRPRRIVQAPGAFVMPIGPIYGGATESAHFLLETVGEEVIRAFPRLFYQYRGVEKRAEGAPFSQGLLLAERFAARSAFAHALAYSRAIEALSAVELPPRARQLRVFFAELERFRHHLGTIEGICTSTGLAVAASQAALLEEEALRLSGALAGHRYLFGLAAPGGLAHDVPAAACREAVSQAQAIRRRAQELHQRLRRSSSFLDRLEQVGLISPEQARDHGLVGPVARASGLSRDLRQAQPYSGYPSCSFRVPCEREGDGYARLRVFFAEIDQAVELMAQAAQDLPRGPVRAECRPAAGAALGWVEAPVGAAFHWVRLDESGRIMRYRLMTPSFANWHGFHLAAEGFAFQDFPIILATFGLSVAENDR
ncbi:MAG TPA: hypothetical protein ENI60_04345 [Candidatus Fraserbacteria bacterium]|nr:hypothetical protein [Candidatus Fraserbacteria bacterium]